MTLKSLVHLHCLHHYLSNIGTQSSNETVKNKLKINFNKKDMHGEPNLTVVVFLQLLKWSLWFPGVIICSSTNTLLLLSQGATVLINFLFQPKLQFKLSLIFSELIFTKDKKNVLTEATNKKHILKISSIKSLFFFQIYSHILIHVVYK